VCAPWAIRWYEACGTFVGVGVLAGVLLATGARWTAGHLLGAHVALNLAGWFGTAIVGTLHTSSPSLTETRLRFAALQRATFACWTTGTAALATGFGFAAGPLVIVGWTALTLAAALLCINLVASLRSAPAAASLSVRLIAPAQACLVLALGLAFAAALGGDATTGPLGSTRAAIAVLPLPGWLGLTVAGSLLHLLAGWCACAISGNRCPHRTRRTTAPSPSWRCSASSSSPPAAAATCPLSRRRPASR
jgi:hypothetical protein